MKSFQILIYFATLGACAPLAHAVTVNEFLTGTPATTGDWYVTQSTTGGTESIVSLFGAGGNLEAAQPLPIGAARLTTINDNNSRAEVGTFNFVSPGNTDFGLASAVLANATLGYDFYKAGPSANLAAAPALKITIFAPGGTGDNFGALVWEPYVQGAGNPAPNVWTNVAINSNSGGGDGDSVGGWWWNGGFNIASGAGGAPFRSLNEWLLAFQTADPTDFPTAHVISFNIGIGSFNPDQINYFDNVSIIIPGYGNLFDFEAVPPAPEPSTLLLLGVGLTGLAVRGRSRRDAAVA